MPKVFTLATRRAFSLIELIVAISIIVLLIALLLPVISTARYHARTAVCASNLRQVGLGLFAYAADARGAYPHNVLGVTTGMSLYNGVYYRSALKPWVLRSNLRFNYAPLLSSYYTSMSAAYMCPHMKNDWQKTYGSQFPAASTNAGYQPYVLMFNLHGNSEGISAPMRRINEGWTPGSGIVGGGITNNNRFPILAGDRICRYVFGPDQVGNHPGLESGNTFTALANADGAGYRYTGSASANYLFTDGRVKTYGSIHWTHPNYRGHIGRWLVPMDAAQ